MAIRRTIYKLKNNQSNNGTLPSSGVQMGEPLVNLYNGILFFSGTTGGDYTPFVDPSNATSGGTYFEVGSNLYNLQLRNKITEYQGETTNLAGKFLSGTTTGFVLANISDIAAATNTYVTGGTWTPNTLTLGLNDGSSASPITIDTFNNLSLYGTTNVNGNLTITGTGLYNTTATGTNPFEIVNYTSLTAFSQTKEVYVTGITLSQSATTSNNNQTYNLTYRGTPLETTNYTITVKDTFVTGGTYDTSTGTITFVKNDATSFQVTGIDGMDTFVTGGTITTAPSNSDNDGVIGLKYNQNVPDGTYTLPFTDTFVTGGTYSNGTITFSYNDSGKTPFQVTGIDGTDTYVTGFTYDSASNKLTISRNQGEPDLPVFIDTVSGLTISNLTAGQVVYVGSDGKLKTDGTGEFAYNDGTNTLTLGTTSGNLIVNNPIGTTATFGQGGVTIGSGGSHSTPGIGDLIVHGNFIVFGTGTTVATNELYVEDPQITLNYNPTGDTSSTSIASGIRVQDGSGTQGTDTYFTVSRLDTLTGLTGNQVPVVTEYTAGGVGNDNRGWLTQLNDIVIRNTNLNNGAPNGVRVLAEFDTLDGGVY